MKQNDFNKFGKEVHDAWVDANTRNLSVDVLNELERRKKTRSRRLAFGVPAFAGAIAIALFFVLYNPTPTIETTASIDTEAFDLTETDVAEALVADVSDEEILDILTADEVKSPDLLTDHDIDIIFED